MVDYGSDGYEPPEFQLRDILSEDDKDKFFSFLKSYKRKGPVDRLVARTICDYGAIKCAKALLEEETDYTFDIHGTLCDHTENFTPLHAASSGGDISMVRLLLRHGAQPNVRSTSLDPSSHIHPYFHNKLPFNAALDEFNTKLNYFDEHEWNPAAHLCRVIIIHCLPEMRSRLKVLRLLVERTEKVEKEISHYVIEGKVVELAALLIVAREKVMSPSVFENLGCADEGSMTFGNFIMREIMTINDLELSSMASGNHELARKCEHRLALMVAMFQLLKIFESVGDRIQTYLKESPRKVLDQKVAKEVASMLVDAGFPVKEEDYNLSTLDRHFDATEDLGYLLRHEEAARKMKTPAIKRGKPESLKFGHVTLTRSFKHSSQNLAAQFNRSLVSMAAHDRGCIHDRTQSLSVELEKLRKHEYLNDWNPRKSIFKLIFILCLPELQGGLLKCIRLLALESKNIGEFSCLCLKEGKLVELAVLLMVARERLIGKTTHSEGASYSDGSVELHKCLMHELSSAIYEETISIATFRSRDLVQICKARNKLMSSARLLFEVFETAGYRIDQYLQSNVYLTRVTNLQVARDVAYLFGEEGFCLRRQDSNLSDMKCFSTKLELEPEQAEKLGKLSKRFPVKDVALRLCFPAHRFSLAEKKHIDISGMLSGQQRTFPIFGSAARSFHTCRSPVSSFGFLPSKPVGTQTSKIVKPLMVSFLSGEQLTMFALAFKRGVKLTI